MQIQSIQCFQGRNIYSHNPVINMVVDIGIYEAGPTREIPGFNKKLLYYFPEIAEHTCGLGYIGGFGERLIEGTYIGHVAEHLIIEIHNKMGYPIKYGKTRQIGNSSKYSIIYEYENETFSIECGRRVVEIVKAFAEGTPIDIDIIMQELKKLSGESDMGPSTKAIYQAAKKRNIPVTRLGTGSILKLGYGKHTRIVQGSLTDHSSCIEVDIVSDKQLTKRILMDNNIPVPYGVTIKSLEEALEAARNVGFPLVIKPLDSNQGKGVTVNIQSEEQIDEAFIEAARYSKKVILERYIKGKDYRVLVVGSKVCAVAERMPPRVIGDGVSTIEELVSIENRNPLRGEDHEKPLTFIKLDDISIRFLKAQGLSVNSILEAGKSVNLRQNGNISTGGTAKNCTQEIHPKNAQYAVAAARALGLDVAGIDFAAEDISCPINISSGAVIEVNAAPGLRMHLYPSEGEPIDVADEIVGIMYPDNSQYSIPIVSITGTNGKTTTTRLIRHTLILTGLNVGMTCTSGIYIGDECIQKGDTTGPVSAGLVLSNKKVDAAVLETARGGIVRKGLGYDLADVGVLVNISDDHLGIDGINTMEELANTKALVIEAVKPDGYAVLNADDAMTPYILSRVRSKVIMFSRQRANPLFKKHCKNPDNIGVFVKDGFIWIQKESKKIPFISLDDIPITFGGLVECNIENSLAAISALLGLQVPLEIIKNGVNSFQSNLKLNPGRFNIFDMGEFSVMLDYSHNIAGYSAVVKFMQRLKTKRLVGIVGMPGDRLDSNIKDVGELCARSFGKIYVKEDIDLRGRKKGEVAKLLETSILDAGANKEAVEIVLSETEALKKAMLDAQPGDMIALFYEEFEPAVQVITKFKSEQETTDLMFKNSLNSDDGHGWPNTAVPGWQGAVNIQRELKLPLKEVSLDDIANKPTNMVESKQKLYNDNMQKIQIK